MTGISMADHVRNPSGLFNNPLRVILHHVSLCATCACLKSYLRSKYFAGVFTFLLAHFPIPHGSPQKEASREGP